MKFTKTAEREAAGVRAVEAGLVKPDEEGSIDRMMLLVPIEKRILPEKWHGTSSTYPERDGSITLIVRIHPEGDREDGSHRVRADGRCHRRRNGAAEAQRQGDDQD